MMVGESIYITVLAYAGLYSCRICLQILTGEIIGHECAGTFLPGGVVQSGAGKEGMGKQIQLSARNYLGSLAARRL